ncbi:MAG: hypothetical protein Q4E91_03035 [Lachnospiraceae bacterium]|nr:hypothetical protein [Lachnospiraceae bacterium]
MKNDEKEIREAITAGEMALSSLYEAQEQLRSARGWGMVDLFGGGFLTDLIKHSKIDSASRCMEDAKYYLNAFQKELRDIDLSVDLRIEVGGFLCFADFFLDGPVADYLVQSKIVSAREQVEEAADRVENILASLKNLR